MTIVTLFLLIVASGLFFGVINGDMTEGAAGLKEGGQLSNVANKINKICSDERTSIYVGFSIGDGEEVILEADKISKTGTGRGDITVSTDCSYKGGRKVLGPGEGTLTVVAEKEGYNVE